VKHCASRASLLWICLWVGLTSPSGAEGDAADEAFRQARELAYAGQREEARALCRKILAEHPDAREVRTLMARTYAWDKELDEARRLLLDLLDARPDDVDARCALIDVELWSDQPGPALELAEEGLRRRPTAACLSYRQSRALASLGRTSEALEAARRALEANPGDKLAVRQFRQLLEDTQRNRVSAIVSWEWFDDIDPWYAERVDYRRAFDWGSLIGRVNLARRFDETGVQFEADAFPKIYRNTYAYLNVGLSSGQLFPELRYGGEIFHNFPRAWEGSLGFRRLEFDSSGVTIWTGSVAKYVGRYWIELRPQYVTKLDGRSLSARLRVRYFFLGRREFLEFAAGGGAGSDRTIIAEPEDLAQRSLRFEYRRRIAHSWILRGILGLRTEDLDVSRERNSVFLAIGFDRLF
jgi:YaiO family outer membrane protein